MEKVQKVIIIGGEKSGKSSYLERCTTGKFFQNYEKTTSPILNRLEFKTNKGKAKFEAWDFPGVGMFSTMKSAYTDIDGCFVFYNSDEETKAYIENVKKVSKNAKIIVIKSKYDIDKSSPSNEFKVYCKENNISLFSVSSKDFCNTAKPILDLIKQLHGKDTIVCP